MTTAPVGPFCLLRNEGLALDATAAGGESDQTDAQQGERSGFRYARWRRRLKSLYADYLVTTTES